MRFILTLFVAARAYRIACRNNNTGYFAITSTGVPQIACFIGLDREAWRITQEAIDGARLK